MLRTSFLALAFIAFVAVGFTAGCNGPTSTPSLTSTPAPNGTVALNDLQTYITISPSSGPADTCVGTICTGSCSSPTCSGGQINGTYGLATMQPTPSLDGKSTLISISAAAANFTDALYYIKTGPRSSAMNFIYDLWFYLSTGADPAALEFDLGQNVGGYKYNFSSQCLLLQGQKKWQIWDQAQPGSNGATSGWIDSGFACNGFSSDTWHHLVWQYSINPQNHQTFYQTLTIDSATPMPVNTGYPAATPDPVNPVKDQLIVQVQIDAKPSASPGTSFTEWVDKVTLTSW
jgi:hypothetical protein